MANKPKIAKKLLVQVLDSGKAAAHFSRVISMQGGPHDLLERPHDYLAPAPIVRDLPAECAGFIESMDTSAIGLSIVRLGGGRRQASDKIDPRVGFSHFGLTGDRVEKGDRLLTIHAASEDAWKIAAAELTSAIVIGRKMDPIPAVYERFS